VIKLLNEQTIPVAANISWLQRQDDDEGRFLRLVSWQGRFKDSFEEARAKMAGTAHGECHQGLFVATTEGELLGTRHTRDPEELLEMLGKAFSGWPNRKTQREVFELEDVVRQKEFDWEYPEGGLVLHQSYVDLERTFDDRPKDWRKDGHNIDYVWITRDEMQSIVPQKIKIGEAFPLPDSVRTRLVRFHLLDMVRGETSPWKPEALEDVEIKLTPYLLGDQKVELKITGRVRLCERGEWCGPPSRISPWGRDEMCCVMNERGYHAEILGYAAYDRKENAFTRFDLVSIGTRWGGTTYNARTDDTEPGPMGIAFTIAGNEPRDRTPPHSRPGSYFSS
jgi:hypothetical protein